MQRKRKVARTIRFGRPQLSGVADAMATLLMQKTTGVGKGLMTFLITCRKVPKLQPFMQIWELTTLSGGLGYGNL
jgi:hypothetical protein